MFYMHSSSCGINYIGKVQVPIGQGCRGTHTVPAFLKKKKYFSKYLLWKTLTPICYMMGKKCVLFSSDGFWYNDVYELQCEGFIKTVLICHMLYFA